MSTTNASSNISATLEADTEKDSESSRLFRNRLLSSGRNLVLILLVYTFTYGAR